MRLSWTVFLRAQLLLAFIVALAIVHHADLNGMYVVPRTAAGGETITRSTVYLVHGGSPLEGMLVIRGPGGVKPLFVAPLARSVKRVVASEPWPGGGWVHGGFMVWKREGWLLVEPNDDSLPRDLLAAEGCIALGSTGEGEVYLCPHVPPLVLWPVEDGVTLLYVFASGENYASYVFYSKDIERIINGSRVLEPVTLKNLTSFSYVEYISIRTLSISEPDNGKCFRLEGERAGLNVLSLFAAEPGTRVVATLNGTTVYTGIVNKALVARFVTHGVYRLCINATKPIYYIHNWVLRDKPPAYSLVRLEAFFLKPGRGRIPALFCGTSTSTGFLYPLDAPLSCKVKGAGNVFVGGEAGCNKWIIFEFLRTGYPLTILSGSENISELHVVLELGARDVRARGKFLPADIQGCLGVVSSKGYDSMHYDVFLSSYYADYAGGSVLDRLYFASWTSPVKELRMKISGLRGWWSTLTTESLPWMPWMLKGVDKYVERCLRYVAPAMLLLPESGAVLHELANPSEMYDVLNVLEATAAPLGAWYVCKNDTSYNVWYMPWPVPAPTVFKMEAVHVRRRVDVAVDAVFPDNVAVELALGSYLVNKSTLELRLFLNSSAGWYR